ncbi:AMP-dependent synthetase and ligase, partial [Pseudomonas coronafaciens pv. garcae]
MLSNGSSALPLPAANEMDRMNWLNLQDLLLAPLPGRLLTQAPELDHAQFCHQALSVAADLQARGVRQIAVHLEDAAELAVALFGAWRAGVHVLLPADLQGQTRERWATQVDLWLTDQPGDTHLHNLHAAPLAPAALDLEQCQLGLCTSGSSGEPKLIEKRFRQLANEVCALEQLWGAELGEACMIGSVATQHIYGLLFRLLWPLCAARSFVRHQ